MDFPILKSKVGSKYYVRLVQQILLKVFLNRAPLSVNFIFSKEPEVNNYAIL